MRHYLGTSLIEVSRREMVGLAWPGGRCFLADGCHTDTHSFQAISHGFHGERCCRIQTANFQHVLCQTKCLFCRRGAAAYFPLVQPHIYFALKPVSGPVVIHLLRKLSITLNHLSIYVQRYGFHNCPPSMLTSFTAYNLSSHRLNLRAQQKSVYSVQQVEISTNCVHCTQLAIESCVYMFSAMVYMCITNLVMGGILNSHLL